MKLKKKSKILAKKQKQQDVIKPKKTKKEY